MALEPQWKKRTYDTHKEHVRKYTGVHVRDVFLGDSMMERWLTTGGKQQCGRCISTHSHTLTYNVEALWKESFEGHVANLGVGGDGVQHLLFRLQGV